MFVLHAGKLCSLRWAAQPPGSHVRLHRQQRARQSRPLRFRGKHDGNVALAQRPASAWRWLLLLLLLYQQGGGNGGRASSHAPRTCPAASLAAPAGAGWPPAACQAPRPARQCCVSAGGRAGAGQCAMGPRAAGLWLHSHHASSAAAQAACSAAYLFPMPAQGTAMGHHPCPTWHRSGPPACTARCWHPAPPPASACACHSASGPPCACLYQS